MQLLHGVRVEVEGARDDERVVALPVAHGLEREVDADERRRTGRVDCHRRTCGVVARHASVKRSELLLPVPASLTPSFSVRTRLDIRDMPKAEHSVPRIQCGQSALNGQGSQHLSGVHGPWSPSENEIRPAVMDGARPDGTAAGREGGSEGGKQCDEIACDVMVR